MEAPFPKRRKRQMILPMPPMAVKLEAPEVDTQVDTQATQQLAPQSMRGMSQMSTDYICISTYVATCTHTINYSYYASIHDSCQSMSSHVTSTYIDPHTVCACIHLMGLSEVESLAFSYANYFAGGTICVGRGCGGCSVWSGCADCAG